MADRLGNVDEHGADNGKLVDEGRGTKGGTTSDDVPVTVDELAWEDAVGDGAQLTAGLRIPWVRADRHYIMPRGPRMMQAKLTELRGAMS